MRTSPPIANHSGRHAFCGKGDDSLSNYIDAGAFKNMILNANAALQKKTQQINDLNVFPVPDGDTGTNMGLTLSNAAKELKKRDFDTISEVSDCTSSALLRGARGNSGVILSLFFRGISKKFKGLEKADASDFAQALGEGVDTAYKSVGKPVEGTILTVSRLSAAAAKKAAELRVDFDAMLESAVSAGEEALANTVEQNPVLKKAGVVDAGGKGFMVILTAMLAALRGETAPAGEEPAQSADETVFGAFSEEDITFTFDTVFTVRKFSRDTELEPLREFLSGIGDCLVIGEDDESFKVHVHTDTPGDAINEAQKYGLLELCKIENMRMQHEALASGQKARSTDDLEEVERELESGTAVPEKAAGIVSVCAGEGMEKLFRELGADGLVSGGQTMNPSTEDILKEINRVPAQTVYVFPNNKNIIMAAEQCVDITDKDVVVVQSKTIPQGISALLNFNPDASTGENTEAMNAAMEAVHTVLVTYAARDSEFDGRRISTGEYITLLDGALIGSYPNLQTLFSELSWSLDDLSPEFITLYYGADVDAEDADAAADILIGNFPDAEVSVVNGGQPVYYYMISVE